MARGQRGLPAGDKTATGFIREEEEGEGRREKRRQTVSADTTAYELRRHLE